MLANKFTCYIRAFSGYKLEGITRRLEQSIYRPPGDIGTVVVLVGTNNIHPNHRSDDERLRAFTLDFTRFFSSLHRKLKPSKVISVRTFSC